MEVSILEVLTEYIAMIGCLYRISKHKIAFKLKNILLIGFNFICVFLCVQYQSYDMKIRIGMYVCILVFIKIIFGFSWREAAKYFGVMMIMIAGLQLLLYMLIGNRILGFLEINTIGIIENCIIILFTIFWNRRYIDIVVKNITWFKEGIFIIVFCVFFLYLFYTRDKTNQIGSQVLIQASLGLIGIALVAILWVNTEKEKRRKAEELRAYEMYTKSFEDTIAAIRMKQHEFKNHINAILCMQYTIQDEEELKNAQMNYCQEILRDNSLNDLLKVKMSPVIIGYLYSKFTFAIDKHIFVKYDIQDISLSEKAAVHNLVEIIGILFDNAVEALTSSEEADKQIYVRIGMNEEEKYFIEIANSSPKYSINEMEAFFQYGNSTKGKDRGIGLYQAKKLAEKCNGIITVENIIYEERNYISFKVIFR
ncbi:MAG: GHKL domain-containing protein [Lachnospiraceae bacterium]|nr:GHKL domain-containing protein [Lachnospiraceae bacterium]